MKLHLKLNMRISLQSLIFILGTNPSLALPRVYIHRAGPSTQIRKAIEFELHSEKNCGRSYDLKIQRILVQNKKGPRPGQIWIDTSLKDKGSTRPEYCMKSWVSAYFTNLRDLKPYEDSTDSLLKFLTPGSYRVYLNQYYHGSLAVPAATSKNEINYIPFKGYRTRGLGFIVDANM